MGRFGCMMSSMGEPRAAIPGPDRLLSVIELQNAIAAAGLNADEVMSLVVERAATLTSATTGSLGLLEGDELVHRAGVGGGRGLAGTRAPRARGLAGRCLSEGRPVHDDRGLAVPLLYGEAAVGAIELGTTASTAFTDEDVETVRLLAQVVAIALHRAYTYPRPRADTMHDVVTGLANRRAFEERLQAELVRNKRYGHSFSVAFLELDGLETVCDRHGQTAGDEALREIAAIVKRHTRAIDACFRVTAEDFAIVMPGTSLEGARVVSERCRAHLAEARLGDGVVASFGVVEAVRGETADELAARAHAAVTIDKHPASR